MITRTLLISLIAALTLTLTACSKSEAPAASPALTAAQSYDAVSTEGKGFTAGAIMSAHTAYVLFDPQCPHCGHLWQATQALQKKVKFVWIPVSIINGKSTSQGAALLTAANPTESMTAHETSLLAGNGGLPASDALSPEMEAAIKANTALFNRLGLESVPFIVAKNARTGKVVTNVGAMTPEALTAWIGLDGLSTD